MRMEKRGSCGKEVWIIQERDGAEKHSRSGERERELEGGKSKKRIRASALVIFLFYLIARTRHTGETDIKSAGQSQLKKMKKKDWSLKFFKCGWRDRKRRWAGSFSSNYIRRFLKRLFNS